MTAWCAQQMAEEIAILRKSHTKCGNENCAKKHTYKGETSYSAYTRGLQHQTNLRNKMDGSPMWRHCSEEHEGEVQPFTMNVTRSFKNDAMLRQITEAVQINNTDPNHLMNTKAEWNMTRIPRVNIVDE